MAFRIYSHFVSSINKLLTLHEDRISTVGSESCKLNHGVCIGFMDHKESFQQNENIVEQSKTVYPFYAKGWSGVTCFIIVWMLVIRNL